MVKKKFFISSISAILLVLMTIPNVSASTVYYHCSNVSVVEGTYQSGDYSNTIYIDNSYYIARAIRSGFGYYFHTIVLNFDMENCNGNYFDIHGHIYIDSNTEPSNLYVHYAVCYTDGTTTNSDYFVLLNGDYTLDIDSSKTVENVYLYGSSLGNTGGYRYIKIDMVEIRQSV